MGIFGNKKFIKINITRLLFVLLYLNFSLFSFQSFGLTKLDELDSLRANLSILSENSPEYLKVEQKLKKFVLQNKIDYSFEARFLELERLIKECKYEAAIYEARSLISNKYKESKCLEYLGDISKKLNKSPSVVAKYYKQAIQKDENNLSATFKLSKLYFREKRNILGIENLKKVVLLSQDVNLLQEIEYIILNKIQPQNRYEANNLYEILGIIYEKEGNYPETYRAYKRAIDLNPQDIFLKYRLADIYLKNNKNSDALKVLNSILETNKSDSQIRKTKADILHQEGNLYEAASEYLAILKEYPNSAYAKYEIYKIYRGKESPKKILEIINKNNPNFSPLKKDYLDFSTFLKNIGDLEGQELFLDYFNSICAKENLADKSTVLPSKNKTISQASSKNNSNSKAQKKTTSSNSSNGQKDLNNKAKLLEKREENKIQQPKKSPEIKVEKKVERKVEQPKKQELKQELKQGQNKTQNAPSAVAKKDSQAQKQPKVPQKTQNQKQEAIQKPKQAPQDEKKAQENKIQQERKAAIKKNSKKYYEHKSALDKYLAINPKDKLTYIAIANTYKLMGEYTNAILNYKNALKLDAIDSDIYFNIALVYVEIDDLENAKTYLEKGQKLSPDDKKIINMLSFVNQKMVTRILNTSYEKFEKKDYVSAFSILDDGIKKFPNSSQMYYYRALIYDAMNRNAAQILDLQKAIDLDPSFYMAYYQLGLAYEKINDGRGALVAYEKFLSIEPDEKDLVDLVQKKVLDLGKKYY